MPKAEPRMIAAHVSKLGRAFEVDVSTLPQAAMDYLAQYGLKQSLNDAAAGAEGKAEAEGLVAKRLDKIVKGEMTVRDGPGRETDPIRLEAVKLAQMKVKAAYKAKGLKVDISSTEYKVHVQKVAASEAVIAEATESVEAAKAAAAEVAALLGL